MTNFRCLKDQSLRMKPLGHSNETALVAELPGLIALALESVATNAQHHFKKGGQHTVTHGVIEF